MLRIEGMNIRLSETITSPGRGSGFRLVFREILLYCDPETGRPPEK